MDLDGVWRRELAHIDEQHEALERDMAALADGVRQGRPAVELARMLDQVIQRFEEHFRHEEVLMTRSGFAELHPHRLLHQSCLSQLRQDRERLALSGSQKLDAVLEQTRTWIHLHVERQDRRFEDHLRRLDGVQEQNPA